MVSDHWRHAQQKLKSDPKTTAAFQSPTWVQTNPFKSSRHVNHSKPGRNWSHGLCSPTSGNTTPKPRHSMYVIAKNAPKLKISAAIGIHGTRTSDGGTFLADAISIAHCSN